MQVILGEIFAIDRAASLVSTQLDGYESRDAGWRMGARGEAGAKGVGARLGGQAGRREQGGNERGGGSHPAGWERD